MCRLRAAAGSCALFLALACDVEDFPMEDAATVPAFWSSRGTTTHTSVVACPVHAGMSFVARVEEEVHCSEPGPVQVHIDAERLQVDLKSSVWRDPSSECEPSMTPLYAIRNVLISGLDAGSKSRTWLLSGGAPPLDIEVLPAKQASCGLGAKSDEPCNADCECATGLACLADDYLCTPHCAMVCSDRRDCPDAFGCSDGECHHFVDYECQGDDECPAGMLCMGDVGGERCRFDPKLYEDAGHACDSDADCSRGLQCVRKPLNKRLTCEYRCATAGMRCSDDRICSPSSWTCSK